jgi:hypothetical protein
MVAGATTMASPFPPSNPTFVPMISSFYIS